MRVDVRHNFGDVAKRLGQLADDVRDKALARTLNKVAQSAAAYAATRMADEFNVTKREARSKIRIYLASRKAGEHYLESVIFVESAKRGRGLNLIRFVKGARSRGGRGRRQLKFQIKRNGSAKAIPGAFIGNDGRTVFIRQGKSRLPIEALTTIDFAQMFNAAGRKPGAANVKGMTIQYIERRLPIVLEQEIKFVTRTR